MFCWCKTKRDCNLDEGGGLYAAHHQGQTLTPALDVSDVYGWVSFIVVYHKTDLKSDPVGFRMKSDLVIKTGLSVVSISVWLQSTRFSRPF